MESAKSAEILAFPAGVQFEKAVSVPNRLSRSGTSRTSHRQILTNTLSDLYDHLTGLIVPWKFRRRLDSAWLLQGEIGGFRSVVPEPNRYRKGAWEIGAVTQLLHRGVAGGDVACGELGG